jgi:hypothetical protein
VNKDAKGRSLFFSSPQHQEVSIDEVGEYLFHVGIGTFSNTEYDNDEK